MTRYVTAGWPALTAYHAALAVKRGETEVVIDGPEDDLKTVRLVLHWTNIVVDSYLDTDLIEHLLVEAIQ